MQPKVLHWSRPKCLYRYAQEKWLSRSLIGGEFRLVPASEYGELVGDNARYDNELLRIQNTPGDHVEITNERTGQRLKPIGSVTYKNEILTNYYTLCFSTSGDPTLFEEFQGSDACLVIHDTNEVCERILHYANQVLPNWTSFDAKVSYGGRSDFGAFYLKDKRYFIQQEWRFTWVPPKPTQILTPFNIRIGDITKFAEIVRVESNVKS